KYTIDIHYFCSLFDRKFYMKRNIILFLFVFSVPCVSLAMVPDLDWGPSERVPQLSPELIAKRHKIDSDARIRFSEEWQVQQQRRAVIKATLAKVLPGVLVTLVRQYGFDQSPFMPMKLRTYLGLRYEPSSPNIICRIFDVTSRGTLGAV